MAKQQFNYEKTDYVDVAARIVEFRTRYPEGCLQPANPAEPFQVQTIGEMTFIVYTAAAYRTPDDPRPGIGTAWEVFPGRTPYTRNSELMNAETSAWGRAIIAVGAADSKKGIASAEEVRNRQAERNEPKVPVKQHTDHGWLSSIEKRIGVAKSFDELEAYANEIRNKKVAGQCEDIHEEQLWSLGQRRHRELEAGGPPRNKDGSISRSRMTDEELAAGGHMTSTQVREHNNLVRDTVANPKKADRLATTPEDDPWTLSSPEGGDAA